MAYQLTEDNIKRATLSFLKTYYKNNSSRGFGETETAIDMMTGSGIIADGYLKFSIENDAFDLSATEAEEQILEENPAKKEKEVFLATFEATSQATAEEVQYQIQRKLLILDALAFASVIAAGSYMFNYLNEQFTLNQLGTFLFFAGFFAVLIASAIGYLVLMKNNARYRYIYAIAQFKKYHADEQWISYGEDVFANPNNKYLLELKKQCIRQGFGLISIDNDLQPALVMTPARENIFSTRRKIRNFFKEKTTNNKTFSWIKGVKVPTLTTNAINTTDYLRYTKSYWKQSMIILASLFIMGEVYLEELKNPNIAYVDESQYEKLIEKETDDNYPEPMINLDSIERVEDQLDRSGKRRISVLKNQPTKRERELAASATNPIAPIKKQPTAFIISTGLDEYISYGCDRLKGFQGDKYLVQIDESRSDTDAIRKVKAFNESGFRANALWLGCFSTQSTEYVIYVDDIFSSKDEAVERANSYQKLMLAKGREGEQTVIRMIKGEAAN